MAKRTNPLLVLRKAIYKGGMTVNPQFNHKKREEMVPLHSYLCMCVHERERERERDKGGGGVYDQSSMQQNLDDYSIRKVLNIAYLIFFPLMMWNLTKAKGPLDPPLGSKPRIHRAFNF